MPPKLRIQEIRLRLTLAKTQARCKAKTRIIQEKDRVIRLCNKKASGIIKGLDLIETRGDEVPANTNKTLKDIAKMAHLTQGSIRVSRAKLKYRASPQGLADRLHAERDAARMAEVRAEIDTAYMVNAAAAALRGDAPPVRPRHASATEGPIPAPYSSPSARARS